MASSGGFGVVLSATDKVSPTIDAVNKKMASLRVPVERVQKAVARFADVSGLTAMGKGFEKIARSSLEAFRNISSVVEPLAAIMGAASIAGMYKLATAWADFGAKLGLTRQLMGMSAQKLNALQGAARLAGSSTEAMTSGLQTLGQTLYDAVAGRAPEAVVELTTLGIAFRDSFGNARKATDVLPEIANKIAGMTDASAKLKVATVLLGGSGADLLPVLRLGAAGLANATQEASRYGVVTDEMTNRALEFGKAQTRLGLAFEQLSYSIGDKLAPVITPILTDMANWVGKNREWVATGLGEAIRKVSTYIKGIDWTAAWKGAEAFAKRVEHIVMMIGRLLGLTDEADKKGAAPPLGSLPGMLNLLANPKDAIKESVGGNGIPLSDLPAGSPLWSGIPPEQQRVYSNSPLNQGSGGSWWNPMTWFQHSALAGQSPVATEFKGGSTWNRANSQQLASYFMKQGWSKEQTAGILANYQGESAMNTRNVGDGGASAGLGQWRGDRRQRYAAMYGHDVLEGSAMEQAEFTQWELTHTEKKAGDLLRMARTANQAGKIVSLEYERPQAQDLNADIRGRYADEWMQGLNAPAVIDPKLRRGRRRGISAEGQERRRRSKPRQTAPRRSTSTSRMRRPA